jgi:hypothetical protein
MDDSGSLGLAALAAGVGLVWLIANFWRLLMTIFSVVMVCYFLLRLLIWAWPYMPTIFRWIGERITDTIEIVVTEIKLWQWERGKEKRIFEAYEKAWAEMDSIGQTPQ